MKNRTRCGHWLTYSASTLVLAFAIAVLAPGVSVAQQKKIRWKMPSVLPSSIPIGGESAVYFSDKLKEITNGRISIKPFDPGKLVPAFQVFEAVSTGAADAGWSYSCYWMGKNSAFALFCTMPFGPSPSEYLSWMYEGGGQKLMEELYAKHNLWATPCNIGPAEASGWFRKEITSLDQFKGMKLRWAGIGGKVLQKLGASVQLIPGGEIYLALERGVIDATEFAVPSIDFKLGFYQVAKHYYFPGWHQPSTLGELLVNKAKWDALDPADRALIKMACRDTIVHSMTIGESTQPAGLREIKKHGVQIHAWPPEFLAAFRKASDEVYSEMIADNPDFARVYKSLTAFRGGLQEWMKLQRPVR